MTAQATSKLPRVQRRERYEAKAHRRSRFLNVHVAPRLREQYRVRAVRVRKGDTAVVMRGKYTIEPQGTVVRHPEAKVTGVDLPRGKVFLEGITRKTMKGKHKWVPIDPSNLLITKLDLSDPVRRKRIEEGREA
jgi:large subunit ribosomal protein L24